MIIKNVSFIGLGVMGYPMAGHLQQNGYNVTVFNRTESKAQKWVEENVFPVENPKFNIVSFDCNICGTLLVQTNQLNYVVE